MARLVLFDLDGTLIDTNRMTARAMEELSGRFGLPVPPEAVVRDAIGLHDSLFYRAIFPEAAQAQLDGLSVEVEQREGEIGRSLGGGVLFPGVAGMLERLRDRGVILCLASTGSVVHVRDMLDCAGIRDCFQTIRCDETDKAAMTGEILRSFRHDAAAFVGDTAIDVAAARHNGIPVIGAGFGYVKPRERALFDAVADTPEALTEMLLDPL